ncbi:hypothetical protein ACR820_01785 [Streptomyces netropsis]
MSSEPIDRTRHYDPGRGLVQFTGRIIVVCPRCGGSALVVPGPGLPEPRHFGELLFQPRRLTCAGCGAVDGWEPEARGAGVAGAVPGGTHDPFFWRPLWLQTRCAGHILWAYNEEHVDELDAHIGARLRERGGVRPTMAMFARLPRWMRAAGNRDEVLAGLETLRNLATRSAPAERSDAAYEPGDHPRSHQSMYFRGGPYRAGRT